MKRILLISSIVYCAVLFAVPCYTIYNYYDILSTGEEYKIDVVIKVKNGDYAIEGLYINGIVAEEYVK
ncbi:MAG: hypothetical protein FWH04_01895 [Oscillospiraceae bacterium]|nr:hypothetical protein [Oscillospiraceae bacterium]